MSHMLTKAAFIWLKCSTNRNIEILLQFKMTVFVFEYILKCYYYYSCDVIHVLLLQS